MTSLEDRLQRRDWDPQPDDTLIGDIVKISERETQYGPYPLLVVRTDDGTDYNVHCLRGGLANPVIKQRPKRGDRIGIRYNGAVPQRGDSSKDAHRYTVEFENDNDTEPDWDRIESQRRTRSEATAGNGDTQPNGDGTTAGVASPSSVNKTWGKDPDPWGETAETPAHRHSRLGQHSVLRPVTGRGCTPGRAPARRCPTYDYLLRCANLARQR